MAKQYMTQNQLKKKNLADIFILILEKQQTTRREIEYETGFSWGTVSTNVSLLLEKGVIVEEKSEKNGSAGRTTYQLSPCPDRLAGVGLDINRSGLTCEIVGLDFAVKKRFSQAFTAQNQAEVMDQAVRLCGQALEECASCGWRAFSLGIAMQGALNGRTGISLRFPDLPDWRSYDVKGHFAREFSLPVYFGHDPKCMLLGEMNRSRYEDCLLVRVDEGIGMAVCLDGRILDDTERFELAHTTVVSGGRLCGCGRRGCLEQYASLRAAAREAGVSVGEILACPHRFSPQLEQAGEYLASALNNVCVLFHPQQMILTGSGAGLSPLMEKTLSGLIDPPRVTVNPAVSAAYGAAVESVKAAIRNFYL